MLTRIATQLMKTPLGLWPVRVRAGYAKGARWTLGPFSANWRLGGAEEDVRAGVSYLKNLDGAVFWDFGAHFGIHTVGMAIQVGPSGQVVSFEPDPVAFKRLQRHVRMNSLSNVKLFQAAASSQDAEGKFFMLDGGGSSNSHFAFHAGHEPEDTPTLIVRTLKPDTLVKRGDIAAPDLIKVDVQGHGHHAIGGSIETIKQAMPVIVFSNHSWEELEETKKLLAPLEYVPRSLDGRSIEWADVGEAVLLPSSRI